MDAQKVSTSDILFMKLKTRTFAVSAGHRLQSMLRWHADFGKSFNGKLVQVEAQFGKVEAMFKDFCGFRMAYAERRLALGIEIVMADPRGYFAHRKNAVSGMASFNIAKGTLNTIGLDCPIWLVGIDP